MSTNDREHLHYSMVIQWSDEDHAYMVSVPEFPGNFTHS
jgi:predicted RNase H-like HicB family nuclease